MNYTGYFVLILFLYGKFVKTEEDDDEVSDTEEIFSRSSEHHTAWKQLPVKTCGHARSPNRIVGGTEAYVGQFPWIARIGMLQKRNNRPQFFCGGALISRIFVLSAAHCFYPKDKRPYFVRLGENNADKPVNCEGEVCAPKPQDFNTVVVELHEKYHPRRFLNDIALLKLEKRAQLHDFVQPICLPRQEIQDINYEHTGQGLVAGWGLTSSSANRLSRSLMFVSLNFVDINKCELTDKSRQAKMSKICVGVGDGKDSCAGDSGGPLMKRFQLPDDSDVKNYLLGVVSYGPKNCGAGPGVYTKIAFQLNWILDKISKYV